LAEVPAIFPEGAQVTPTPRENAPDLAVFLDHWDPDFGLVIGAPNTPQLLQEAAHRGIPLFHASPSRTSGGAQRYPSYLHKFHTCLAASATEAEAMRQQFRGKSVSVEIAGPLSDTVLALPCNEAECDQLAKLLGGRPVWLAAGVDGAEIDMIERAHRKAFRSAHRLLLILVPTNPDDAPKIAGSFEADGWLVFDESEPARVRARDETSAKDGSERAPFGAGETRR